MNTELMTDDEALRLHGMTDGPKTIGKFTLRPLTVETLAWMQTAGVFDDNMGKTHQKAAYVIIHTVPKKSILPMVFSRPDFWVFVSDWICENISHHSELDPYSKEFESAWDRYDAAITNAANRSDPQPVGIKN